MRKTLTLLAAVHDAATTRMLKNNVARWGIQASFAADRTQVLRALEGPSAPDILVLDWDAAGVKGIEVCQELRQRRVHDQRYVLLIAEEGAEPDLTAAFTAGVDDYLIRPVILYTLKERVDRAAQRIRSGQQGRDAQNHTFDPSVETTSVEPESPTSASHAGRLLGGRYRVNRPLRAADDWALWDARDVLSGTRVAVRLSESAHGLRLRVGEEPEPNLRARMGVREGDEFKVIDTGVSPGGLPYVVTTLLEHWVPSGRRAFAVPRPKGERHPPGSVFQPPAARPHPQAPPAAAPTRAPPGVDDKDLPPSTSDARASSQGSPAPTRSLPPTLRSVPPPAAHARAVDAPSGGSPWAGRASIPAPIGHPVAAAPGPLTDPSPPDRADGFDGIMLPLRPAAPDAQPTDGADATAAIGPSPNAPSRRPEAPRARRHGLMALLGAAAVGLLALPMSPIGSSPLRPSSPPITNANVLPEQTSSAPEVLAAVATPLREEAPGRAAGAERARVRQPRGPAPSEDNVAEALRAGDVRGARRLLIEVLRRSPSRPPLIAKLGSLYAMLGDRDAALAATTVARRVGTVRVSQLCRLANLQRQERNLAGAIETLRLALVIDPGDRRARATLERLRRP